MAFLGETFDTTNLPATNTYDLIPAGWYTATITEADLREAKSGAGQYIKLRFDVIGPTHQGRVVFTNINIRHQNLKAEEIGRRQLGALIRAIGLPRVSDTDELVGHTVQIKVTVQPESALYPASNEVRGYKPVPSAARPTPTMPQPAMPQHQAAPTQAAPAADKPLPPWVKR